MRLRSLQGRASPARHARSLLASAIALCALPASAAGLHYYEPWFTANGLSGDGRVAIGRLAGYRNADNRDSAAFAPPSGVTQSIGLLRATDAHAEALAASYDGSVIVGASYACFGTIRVNCVPVAFRWTAAGGMVQLPGSDWSEARDVSDDGAIAVGYIVTGVPQSTTAVLWRGTGPAESLGVLSGGRWSRADAISADGSTVVGTAHRPHALNPEAAQAFRWTTAGMMALGVLAGDDASRATDVSSDGSVVVGASSRVGALCCSPVAEQAFRWTAAGGMQGLGHLPGHDRSVANAVSGDGSIVVGISERFGVLNLASAQAFRWTAATGIQTVDAWLATHGVAVPSTVTLLLANGISRDGTVVIGRARETGSPVGTRDIAWVARVDGDRAGLISDLGAYQRGLAGSGLRIAAAASELPRGVLGGVHRRALFERGGSDDASCAWAGVESASAGSDDLRTRRWEAGACRDLGRWRLGLGLNGTSSRTTLPNDGKARIDAWHLVFEAARPLGDRFEGEVLAAYGEFDLTEDRRYANGAGMDTSRGEGRGHYDTVRMRLLAPALWRAGAATFTPYAAITHARTELRPFVEAGGAFAARHGGARWRDTDAAIGLHAQFAIGERTRLTPTVEFNRRIAHDDATLRLDTGGLFGFDLPVQSAEREWWRGGLDVDRAIGRAATLRAGVYADTRDADSIGVGLSYGLRF